MVDKEWGEEEERKRGDESKGAGRWRNPKVRDGWREGWGVWVTFASIAQISVGWITVKQRICEFIELMDAVHCLMLDVIPCFLNLR